MTKRTLLFTILCLALGVLSVSAKDGKIIYIENFTYAEKVEKNMADNLRNKIIQGLTAKDRFVLKDSNAEETLKATTKKTTTTKKGATKEEAPVETVVEETIDNATLAKYKKLKANYVIKGNITALQVNQKTKDDGSIEYVPHVTYTLNLINVTTGAIEGTESYKYPSAIMLLRNADTESKALENAFNEVQADMDKLVDRYFPVAGKVIQISKEKKGKAQEVYINLGSKKGIQRGQKFEVYVEKNIAGSIAESLVGELQAEAVEGEDLTRCKVNGGKTQEAIKEAMDKQENVIVKSVEQKKSIMGEGLKMFGM